jgi:hypothetical protein
MGKEYRKKEEHKEIKERTKWVRIKIRKKPFPVEFQRAFPTSI